MGGGKEAGRGLTQAEGGDVLTGVELEGFGCHCCEGEGRGSGGGEGEWSFTEQ